MKMAVSKINQSACRCQPCAPELRDHRDRCYIRHKDFGTQNPPLPQSWYVVQQTPRIHDKMAEGVSMYSGTNDRRKLMIFLIEEGLPQKKKQAAQTPL